MHNFLKMLASRFPKRYQQTMKRFYFGRQIKKGIFRTEEQEFDKLAQWVQAGDLVLDIGANIGYYTIGLSKLVGRQGRVLAFEPEPNNFELLTANVARFPFKNVTLLNVAASDKMANLGMSIPIFDNGLDNSYMATLTDNIEELSVLCLPIDVLLISLPVTLAKIDVEGHEMSVLRGMKKLLKRDHPVLIVEGDSDEVASYLNAFGYSYKKLPSSPNRIYLPS